MTLFFLDWKCTYTVLDLQQAWRTWIPCSLSVIFCSLLWNVLSRSLKDREWIFLSLHFILGNNALETCCASTFIYCLILPLSSFFDVSWLVALLCRVTVCIDSDDDVQLIEPSKLSSSKAKSSDGKPKEAKHKRSKKEDHLPPSPAVSQTQCWMTLSHDWGFNITVIQGGVYPMIKFSYVSAHTL